MTRLVHFSEAFEVISDRGLRVPQREYQTSGALPVVDQGAARIGGYTDRLELAVATPGPVLVFGDHTRRVKYVDFEFAVGAQGVKILRPRPGLDARYAYYALQATPIENRGYGRHFALLRQRSIPLPSMGEQKRIVDVLEDHLSRLEAADSYTTSADRRLDGLRIALSDQLLTVEGVLTSVGETSDVISGPAFRSRNFGAEGEGVRLLRGDNIAPGELRWDRVRTWPEQLLPGYEHLHLAKDDLVLAMDRPIISTGLKLARVSDADVPALLVQRVARIRTRPGVIPGYLYAVLQSRDFRVHLQQGQVGTQLPHITLERVRSFKFPLPELNEQARRLEVFSQSFGLCERLDEALVATKRRSTSLRRSLLSAAFSGRLTGSKTDLVHTERGPFA